jgi:hypothetical protein
MSSDFARGYRIGILWQSFNPVCNGLRGAFAVGLRPARIDIVSVDCRPALATTARRAPKPLNAGSRAVGNKRSLPDGG